MEEIIYQIDNWSLVKLLGGFAVLLTGAGALIVKLMVERIKMSWSSLAKKEIEEIKSELSKNNISYQISLAELTKMRFVKIEELIKNLIFLQDYIRENLFIAENDEDFRKNQNGFNELYKKADLSRKICTLYIRDELVNNIIDVLNNSHDAYTFFVQMYHTNPKQLGEISVYNLTAIEIQQKLSNENYLAYSKLMKEVDKFPTILKELSTEFKKHVILKNIEE